MILHQHSVPTDTDLLEAIYDKYSPMLYSIALQLSPNAKGAEKILINTFTRFYKSRMFINDQAFTLITLIRLLFTTSQYLFDSKSTYGNIHLKQFTATPLLQKIFSETTSIEKLSIHFDLNPEQLIQKIQKEFLEFRTISFNNTPE